MNQDKFNTILAEITEGKSLRTACKEIKMSTRTFYDWIAEDEKLQQQYAHAMEQRATALVEEMIEIADDRENDTYVDGSGVERTDHEHIQRSKLRVDTRKWIASKLKPKKYGDSSQIKIANHEGNELKVNALFNIDLKDVQTHTGINQDTESNEED